MKAYKGFDKNMQCRGFQYVEGVTYEEPDAKLCESGFHACTMPLDVLGYYAPGHGSIYREVELEGGLQRRPSGDSKVCAKKIRIGAELGIAGLVKAQIEWVKETSGFDENIKKAKSATGFQGASCATGDQGASCATGPLGASCATGDRGASCATGPLGASCATGFRGASCATGDRGASCATGFQGASCATGDQGASCATGFQGASCATGFQGAALATGTGGRVMGALGCALFAVERKANGDILSVAAAIVDGETIKPNTWYTCRGGKLVEVRR